MKETLKVRLVDQRAQMPTKGSLTAAGYDLYALEDTVIPATGHTDLAHDKIAVGRGSVRTGIAIGLPHATYGRISPRSGLAVKHGIDVLAGVVDEGYTGEVIVLLANLTSEAFQIKAGDRVAQLVVERIALCEIEECSELGETDRGAGGFGSTGR